ncbi:uncharacterized protein LOC142636117 [Castanea sativa]|uniref:uncharacterized protein LOC142636117 n=1 Tax=Castanea sativa TaxID=21020 RepID=UPI003F64E247
MSWLCWNVRGLGNQRTVHKLASVMRAQDHVVVFLAKTWTDEDRLTKLCDDLQFNENLPWMCAGDFNEILLLHEKLGGAPRSETAMREFREVVDDCGFMDLGYMGRKFTWRGKWGDGMVLERLDRALATYSWFEHVWLKEHGCRDIVGAAWVTSLPLSTSPSVHEKIKLCGDKLMEWSKCSFGRVKNQIEEKSKLLERAEFKAALGADYETVRILRLEVNDLLDKEILMWQQWARALHLKFDDSNTSFFHNKAS